MESTKVFRLIDGRAIDERTAKLAYEIATGNKAEDHDSGFTDWLSKECRSYPVALEETDETILSLTETGDVELAAQMYYRIYAEQNVSLKLAKDTVQRMADHPNMERLAVELDDIDKTYDWYDWSDRLDGRVDFVDDILCELRSGKTDMLKKSLELIQSDLDPSDEKERDLLRRINIALRRLDNHFRAFHKVMWNTILEIAKG